MFSKNCNGILRTENSVAPADREKTPPEQVGAAGLRMPLKKKSRDVCGKPFRTGALAGKTLLHSRQYNMDLKGGQNNLF